MGEIRLNLPKELHKEIKKMAKHSGELQNDLLVELIASAVQELKDRQRMAEQNPGGL